MPMYAFHELRPGNDHKRKHLCLLRVEANDPHHTLRMTLVELEFSCSLSDILFLLVHKALIFPDNPLVA